MIARRHAIYYTPPPGPLARFGDAWLGWDPVAGIERAHPEVVDLPAPVAEITAAPRRYGFHGTIMAPFRLAPEATADALAEDLVRFTATRPPVALHGLSLAASDGYVALRPDGDSPALDTLAGAVVEAFESYRAPLDEAELARRRAAGLTPGQDRLLLRWGYPYVMEAFGFHMTLSGKLKPADAERVRAALRPHLTPLLAAPYLIDALTLVAEDAETGRFHQVGRYTFSG